MWTIDASVWIRASEPREEGSTACSQLLTSLARQSAPILVPNLVLIEIAGAVSRLRDPVRADEVVQSTRDMPGIVFLPLDGGLADTALMLARTHRLRGADAVYAAVAARYSTRLISCDREMLTRLRGAITVMQPQSALDMIRRIGGA